MQFNHFWHPYFSLCWPLVSLILEMTKGQPRAYCQTLSGEHCQSAHLTASDLRAKG